MPTADASLAPALARREDEPGSSRRLDDVGPLSILEAMVEQRRRSSQPAIAVELDDEPVPETLRERGLTAELHEDEVPPRRAVAESSAGFLKAR